MTNGLCSQAGNNISSSSSCTKTKKISRSSVVFSLVSRRIRTWGLSMSGLWSELRRGLERWHPRWTSLGPERRGFPRRRHPDGKLCKRCGGGQRGRSGSGGAPHDAHGQEGIWRLGSGQATAQASPSAHHGDRKNLARARAGSTAIQLIWPDGDLELDVKECT